MKAMPRKTVERRPRRSPRSRHNRGTNEGAQLERSDDNAERAWITSLWKDGEKWLFGDDTALVKLRKERGEGGLL
jgi:hypothetical protein